MGLTVAGGVGISGDCLSTPRGEEPRPASSCPARDSSSRAAPPRPLPWRGQRGRSVAPAGRGRRPWAVVVRGSGREGVWPHGCSLCAPRRGAAGGKGSPPRGVRVSIQQRRWWGCAAAAVGWMGGGCDGVQLHVQRQGGGLCLVGDRSARGGCDHAAGRGVSVGRAGHCADRTVTRVGGAVGGRRPLFGVQMLGEPRTDAPLSSFWGLSTGGGGY